MGLPRYLLCCALLAACTVPLSGLQGLPVKSDQEVLIELEEAWNEAFYRKDLDFIEGILADEFIATYDDGSRGDKARELKLVTEFDQQVQSAIPDEFTVRVFGDTAVVWFTLRLVGLRQGQPAEVTLRLTDVWVIRDGMWQCVSTQSTKVSAQ
jgi:ketosteroid isomerase-like protein